MQNFKIVIDSERYTYADLRKKKDKQEIEEVTQSPITTPGSSTSKFNFISFNGNIDQPKTDIWNSESTSVTVPGRKGLIGCKRKEFSPLKKQTSRYSQQKFKMNFNNF